ncbi:MAG: 1-acyl-sn-glycerol-3-phosphate acyltransferase [Clostridia bacterium]|nr:1-acyl-sn-glycerol-3-phosphate acyltransferase [Clostridia bacterium]
MNAEIPAAAPKKERTFVYSLARALSFLGGHTIFPVRYHHTENFDLKAPYILIANHQSWLDPLIVAKPCKQYEIRFVGKKELNKNKLIAKVLSKLHMITVDRHNTDLNAMRQCTKVLREGHVLGIFPEGTRHQKDLMAEVETGTALLALRAKVPLLPVYVQHKPRFLRMNHVYIGEPMDISDLCAQGFDAQVAEQLTHRIRNTFLQMREDSRKK